MRTNSKRHPRERGAGSRQHKGPVPFGATQLRFRPGLTADTHGVEGVRSQFFPGGFQSIFTLLHLYHEEAS